MRSVVRRSIRYRGAAAALLFAAIFVASGCTPESSLSEVACEDDSDCDQRGTECDEGYCVVVDAQQSSLTVEVQGLPEGLQGDVLVEGPEDFERRITGTETLEELWAGDYSITAESVEFEGRSYESDADQQDVTLEVDDSQTATVDYGVVSGVVDLEVQGLPEDADPTIELVDAAGEVAGEFGDENRIEDLEPGEYTVAPGDYETEDSSWRANAADLEVRSGETAEVQIEYIVDPGSVVASVTGLPEGTTPNIELVGDEQTYPIAPTGARLAAVEPGTYSVESQNAVVEEDWTSKYTAETPDITVRSNEETAVDIDYGAVAGEVEVDAQGLPNDDADPTIELVDGEDEVVGETNDAGIVEDVPPGVYTVEPGDWTEDGNRWEAEPVEVTVDSEETSQVGVDYAAASGHLQVTVEGLPYGVAPDLQLVSEADSNQTHDVGDDGLVEDLSPGSYTLEIGEVDEPDGGPATWEAADGDIGGIEVTSDDTTDVTATYEVITGQLEVTAQGLDGAGSANIQIEGGDISGDYSLGEGQTETFDDAQPGDYVVTPDPFEHDGSNYSAPVRVVEVRSGEPTTVTVDYQVSAGFGAVAVDIGGLQGQNADVQISDAEGEFSQSLTESGTLEGLTPGDYQIDVGTVEDGSARFTGDYGDTVQIESGMTTYVNVDYALEPGALTLEASGNGGQGVRAELTGPETRVVETADNTTTVEGLAPGDYTVEFLRVDDGAGTAWDPDTATQNTTVYSTGFSEPEKQNDDPVAASYTVVPGELSITVDGLPADQTAPIDLQGASGGQISVSQGETWTDSGLDPDQYDIVPADVTDDAGMTYDASTRSVDLASEDDESVTVDYDADAGAMAVGIEGLPDGLDADVTVDHTDNADFSPRTVTSSTTLEDLPTGTYEVTVADVTDGSPTSTYVGTGGGQVDVTRSTTNLVEIDYELKLADLTVAVQGLEGNVADVDIVDDETGDVVETVSTSGTADAVELEPGTYTVDFPDQVTSADGDRSYEFDDSDPTVTLESGDSPTETGNYSLLDGTLEVTVSGTGGNEATVEVADESGVVDTVTTAGTDSVAVPPGDYSLQPGDVSDGPTTYRADDVDGVSVASDDTTSETITYEAVTGTLRVEVSIPEQDGGGTSVGGSATFDIGGPESKSFTVEPGTTVEEFELEGGTYDVTTSQPDAITDYWNNPFYLQRIETTELEVPSEGQTDHVVSVELPTEVISEADDGSRGTFREVVGRVNVGSEISFTDSVSQIDLVGANGPITVDKPVSIIGDGATIAGETGVDHRLMTLAHTETGETLLQNLTLQGGNVAGAAEPRGAGLEIDVPDGDVTLFDVDFTDNTADSGGALYVRTPAGGATNDGTVHLKGSTFTQNSAVNGGDGGALYAETGTDLTLEQVEFDNNESTGGAGGAAVLEGDGAFDEAHFVNNTASTNGGALLMKTDASVDVEKALFESNDATDGGGLYSIGELFVKNTTFTQNSADTGSGAGGAVYFEDDGTAARILHATMVENDASEGGAVWSDGSDTVMLKSSFLNENTTTATDDIRRDTSDGSDSPVESAGTNFVESVNTGAETHFNSEIGDDDTLNTGSDHGPLQSGGGFTQIHPINSGNPGYEDIDDVDCRDFNGDWVVEDQRNASRPGEDFCSRGAWEDK